MDFRNGQELLELCQKENISISEAMKTREITCGTLTSEEIDEKLKTVLTIMKDAVNEPNPIGCRFPKKPQPPSYVPISPV